MFKPANGKPEAFRTVGGRATKRTHIECLIHPLTQAVLTSFSREGYSLWLVGLG